MLKLLSNLSTICQYERQQNTYNRVKNKLLPRIRPFREITFFMLYVARISKVILNAKSWLL
jgi:hypothetical protein